MNSMEIECMLTLHFAKKIELADLQQRFLQVFTEQ